MLSSLERTVMEKLSRSWEKVWVAVFAPGSLNATSDVGFEKPDLGDQKQGVT